MTPARRILAVDFGERRIGLAATDFTGSIIVPLPAWIRENDEQAVAGLLAHVAERNTEVVVFGLPLSADGSKGPRAQRTEQFIERMRKRCPCPIETVDESLTSDEAHDRLKSGGMKASRRKQHADSVAAIVILERWRARR